MIFSNEELSTMMIVCILIGLTQLVGLFYVLLKRNK